jgi:hypothetical protein
MRLDVAFVSHIAFVPMHQQRNNVILFYQGRYNVQGQTGSEGCQDPAIEKSQRDGLGNGEAGFLLEIEKAGSTSPFSVVSKN